MAAAVVGPTPGNCSSSPAPAVLMLTGPALPTVLPPGRVDDDPTPAGAPSGGTTDGGSVSARCGTYRRPPSATGAARFNRSPSASGRRPPAALTRSATRLPAGNRYTPGWLT